MHRGVHWVFGLASLAAALTAVSRPVDLTDRFDLPPGFHIHRVAGAEITGGSYSLTFDGEGRLLVGDGNAVRRLGDKDGDGEFDSFEVIAQGLGSRGPQGLLVCDERLYAVGGDGVQLFDGYGSAAPLIHRGRLGQPFRTGGDHDAHTLLRGHDGWLYLMAGNGAGTKDRVHITEESSPCLFEREASVFRISPDGSKWECLAAGGRNPPSLGLNYLGDFFSFDSDMEWHVGLPWYRPVRLNHWAIGGDQGWQEVGAFPPYYPDSLPGILDVGRGSPTWGTFYEHVQFPEKYRDAFLVCDYRWKNQSNDKYATTGRLLAFFLQREGAGWKASMEVLAKPKPNARDASGKPIDFALVDCAIAPDGSVFLTDHNQGVWRIFYESLSNGGSLAVPRIVPDWPALPAIKPVILSELLTLPQPGSERTRLREEQLKSALGSKWQRELEAISTDPAKPLRRRLRAIQLISPQFANEGVEERKNNGSASSLIAQLASDRAWEIRSQAAWLCGISGRNAEVPKLLKLLDDSDAFVRRRAAEGLTRAHSSDAIPKLVEHLADTHGLIRHICMSALAHYPSGEWLDRALAQSAPQIQIRALAACSLRREPPPNSVVQTVVRSLSEAGTQGEREDQLGFLRLLTLFQPSIASNAQLTQAVNERLLADFPVNDRDVRWERIRIFGAYEFGPSFPKLLAALESEPDPVTQFHIAQSLAKLPSGWKLEEEARLLKWFLSTQTGWFSEFKSKGVEFPAFWQTVLTDFATHHAGALLHAASNIDLSSLLGSTLIQLIGSSTDGESALLDLYRHNSQPEARRKLLAALKQKPGPRVVEFLRQEELSRADGVAPVQRGDGELHSFILTDSSRGGSASRGAGVYERLQCHTCHGGAASLTRESRIFGPDLAGVTRRLTRAELADALIYPSRQVADRFKAMEVTLRDGTSFTGFITEQTSETVTLADRDQVHRIPRPQVEKIAPHSASLMPDRLLNSLTNEEIRGLLAYLEAIGASNVK